MSDPGEPHLSGEVSLGDGRTASHLVFPSTPDAQLPLPPGALRRQGSSRWAAARPRAAHATHDGAEVLILEEKVLRVLDGETGQLRELLLLPDWVRDAAWDREGRRLAFFLGYGSQVVHLWRRGEGACATLPIGPRLEALAFDPGGGRLYLGSEGLWALDLASGALRNLVRAPGTQVVAVSAGPGGRAAALADPYPEHRDDVPPMRLLVHDGGEAAPRNLELGVGREQLGDWMVHSRDGGRVRTRHGLEDRPALDLATGAVVRAEGFPPVPRPLVEASRGGDPASRLVFAGDGEAVALEPAPPGRRRLATPDGTTEVTFSPRALHVRGRDGRRRDLVLPDVLGSPCLAGDGTLLAYLCQDRLELFDLLQGAPAGSFEVPGARPTALALSPSGRFLAAGFDDLTLRVFDQRSQAMVDALTGHAAPLTHLAFAPLEDRLASRDASGVTYLWDGERVWGGS